MLVVMNPNATEQEINRVVLFVEERGFEARLCKGETKSVVAAVGNKEIDKRDIELLPGVHEVIKLTTSLLAMCLTLMKRKMKLLLFHLVPEMYLLSSTQMYQMVC